jgi:hypothetical protein
MNDSQSTLDTFTGSEPGRPMDSDTSVSQNESRLKPATRSQCHGRVTPWNL